MAPTHTLIRQLSPTESRSADGGRYVGYSTQLAGPVDLAAWQEAFAILRSAYPVLAARIGYTAAGQAVLETDDASPGVVSAPETADTDPLFGFPDLCGRTSALSVVRHDVGTSSVTLVTHHAIADGPHSLRLLADLWTYYTGVIEGRPQQPVPHPYPESLETLLSERGFVPEAPTWEMPPTREPLRPRTTPPSRTRVRFTADETDALHSAGRRLGTTINGLVSAALLQTAARTHGFDVSDLIHRYAINLRERVDPPIGLTEGTSVFGMVHFVADPAVDTSDAGTAALAGAIVDRLADELSTGRIQRAALAEALGPAMPTASPMTVISTNLGTVPDLPTPTGVTVTDFRVVVPPGQSRPPRTTPPPPQTTPLSATIITTFNRQLALDSTVSPDEMTEIVQRIRQLL
ncbi:phthiocerol/phthiodiolone dimycocerosyl transferase family protein [Nocardia nepalensis]|uniref:phthiocerol/phthiodiolone dimycocerosyl transferase family protein n=1 Tax=Nocardia nepalensis TaxID=3375448 RepID=UPI003B66F58A